MPGKAAGRHAKKHTLEIVLLALLLMVALQLMLKLHSGIVTKIVVTTYATSDNEQQQQQGGPQRPCQQQAAAGDAAAVPSRPVTTASSAVMFGLISRDVASELPYVLSNVGRLAAHFQQAHVVFVENDSQDKTRAVFESWAANFTQGRSNRTARLVKLKDAVGGHKDLRLLAAARNAYIEQLSQPEYSDVSVLIAVDTDMCFAWDVGSMVQVIDDLLPAMSTEWHVLSANGVCGWYGQDRQGREMEGAQNTPGVMPIYCDLLALRDTHGRQHRKVPDEKVAFVPGTCDFSHMAPSSASSFECPSTASLW